MIIKVKDTRVFCSNNSFPIIEMEISGKETECGHTFKELSKWANMEFVLCPSEKIRCFPRAKLLLTPEEETKHTRKREIIQIFSKVGK